MKQTFFKYRSLKNFSRFGDILLNNRLYGSLYQDLDDAMEGRFKHPVGLERSQLDRLKSYSICSLSKTETSSPMWALYADNNNGCCIEVEVISKEWKAYNVEYSDTLPSINDSVEKILTTKSKEWSHQQEVRFLKTAGKYKTKYMKVKIKRIIFGLRIPNSEFALYTKLIHIVDSSIKVEKQRWKSTTLGYLE